MGYKLFTEGGTLVYLPDNESFGDQHGRVHGAALPRAANRASWWDSLRSPDIQMPQREACLAAGFKAVRMPDGKSVRFTKLKLTRR